MKTLKTLPLSSLEHARGGADSAVSIAVPVPPLGAVDIVTDDPVIAGTLLTGISTVDGLATGRTAGKPFGPVAAAVGGAAGAAYGFATGIADSITVASALRGK